MKKIIEQWVESDGNLKTTKRIRTENWIMIATSFPILFPAISLYFVGVPVAILTSLLGLLIFIRSTASKGQDIRTYAPKSLPIEYKAHIQIELIIKVEADNIKQRLLNYQSINFLNFIELLKFKNTCNPYLNDLNVSIEDCIKTYQEQRKDREEVHKVSCNFKSINTLYILESEVVEMFINNFDIRDLIKYRIDYKSPVIAHNIHLLLSVNNIKKMHHEYENTSARELTAFLLFIRGLKIKEDILQAINNALGENLASIELTSISVEKPKRFEKNELEQLIDIIESNKEKMNQEQLLIYEALKGDYAKAIKLKVINEPECVNLFKEKFNHLIKEYEEEERIQKDKFIRYLKKMN